MPRAAILISALSLAVATATTLLALEVVLTDDATTAAPATATAAVARAFVAAVADLLRTGDAAGLEAVVAPDVVDHAPAAAAPGGRDGLVRELATLRGSFAALDLVGDDVVADGGLAAVRLTFRGTRPGAVLGIPLDPAPATWREIDVLRIADGMVAERWAAGDAVGLVAPLADTVLAGSPSAPTVALARFTFAAHSGLVDPVLPGPGLLVVESGTLVVRGNGTASVARDGTAGRQDPLAVGTEATAGAGDAILVPAAAPGVRNDGATPAVALAVAVFPAVGEGMGRSLAARNGGSLAARTLEFRLAMVGAAGDRAVLGSGVVVDPIAVAAATTLPAGPVAVGLGRAVLPPGTSLPGQWVPGLELLAVETGALRLAVTPAPIPARPPDPLASPVPSPTPVAVEAGGVAAVQAATIGAVRGTGDATLELLLVVVAAAPTTDAP